MRHYKHFLFFGILLLGAFFRFINPNWDNGFHLHPDERFLTMVGNAMKLPNSFFDYMNPAVSTFNPKNVNFGFFVYGTFPLILNKMIAIALNNDDYFRFTIQGRMLSAFFDLLVIIFIYKTVELFEKKYHIHTSLKHLASFFYAIAIFPIQLSHFFIVDTFLNFFMFASFYYSLKFFFKSALSSFILGAVFLGLAFACKITAVFILPLNLLFLLKGENAHFTSRISKNKFITVFYTTVLVLYLYLGISYLTLKIANPYMFENQSILNPKISAVFLENIKQLSTWNNKDAWFPPSNQWINKPPVFFTLMNLALFCVGIPYFIFLTTGLYSFCKKYKKSILIFIFLWTISIFFYQSIQFVKTMRYIIFLFPFFAIFASFGFLEIGKRLQKTYLFLLILILLIYPFSFISIYIKEQTRIQTSTWMYENIPNESFLLEEHWDDPLPLLLPYQKKHFRIEFLLVFDPDTPEKMAKIKDRLQEADYLVFSSNRGWGSIPTVPERYPLMSKFYSDLFEDKLGYKKIKEFTSYPTLTYLGIPVTFSDELAEELFTVYDHPKVLIFKKDHELKNN